MSHVWQQKWSCEFLYSSLMNQILICFRLLSQMLILLGFKITLLGYSLMIQTHFIVFRVTGHN